MKTFESKCPCCERILVFPVSNIAPNLNPLKKIIGFNVKPDIGDLTVCGYCATMLKFNEDLQLSLLTTKEFKSLDPDLQEEMNNTVYLIVNMHK